MRVLLQRVSQASVRIENKVKGEINQGLMVLVGIEDDDDKQDIDWLARKILSLRIFEDEAGKMNRSVVDIMGGILIVSQFTLHARVKKGTRPSFDSAAKPSISIPLYEQFVAEMESQLGRPVETGTFGATMEVALINDGPVTIWIDSKNRE